MAENPTAKPELEPTTGQGKSFRQFLPLDRPAYCTLTRLSETSLKLPFNSI